MKVFYNNKGKVAGWLKNGIYYKEVSYKKHYMKIYAGYGIDREIVDDHEMQANCELIRLRETDTKRIYEASYDTFMTRSIEKDWGHGRQCFLSLKYWILEDATLKLF